MQGETQQKRRSVADFVLGSAFECIYVLLQTYLPLYVRISV